MISVQAFLITREVMYVCRLCLKLQKNKKKNYRTVLNLAKHQKSVYIQKLLHKQEPAMETIYNH